MTVATGPNCSNLTISNESHFIRDVWDYNLEEEMALIRQIIVDFPYVAMVSAFFFFFFFFFFFKCLSLYLLLGTPLSFHHTFQDTEFPGVVARPVGSFKSSNDYRYQTLRCNVDLLRIIQLGNCSGFYYMNNKTRFDFHGQ